MNKKLARIIAAALLLAVAIVIEHNVALPLWQLLLIYLVPYLIVGYDTLKSPERRGGMMASRTATPTTIGV